MRRVTLTLSLLGLLLAGLLPGAITGQAADPAGAPSDGPALPQIQLVLKNVTTPVAYGASCGDFTIDYTVAATGTFVSDVDAAGKVLREVRHITFTGTLVNHTTGKAVPYHGKFINVHDLQTKTFTMIGVAREVTGPDGRVLARESGVQVQDEATGKVLYEQGTFDITHKRTQRLCAALR